MEVTTGSVFEVELFTAAAYQMAAERNLARRQIDVYDKWLQIFPESGHVDPLWCLQQPNWWLYNMGTSGAINRQRHGK